MQTAAALLILHGKIHRLNMVYNIHYKHLLLNPVSIGL